MPPILRPGTGRLSTGYALVLGLVVTTPRVFLNTGQVTPFADPFIHRQLHTFGFSHLHVVAHTFPTVIVPGAVVTHGPLVITPGRRFRNPPVFIGGRRSFRR